MDLPEDNPISKPTLPTQPDKVRTVNAQPINALSHNNLPSKMLMAFGVSLLLVATAALVFGQRIGYHRGLSYASEQAKKIADGQEITASNVKALSTKTQTLQRKLTEAQQERDISLANLAQLRDSTQSLHITNLQLAQEQEFLTSVLAKKGGVGLQVVGAKIAPLPENAYEYRFDVGMVDSSNKEKPLKPKLTLLNDENMVEVPLEPSSYSIKGIARIRGRFLMPKDFVPKQIKLELNANGQKVEQIYDWQLGQPIDNMPYSLEEIPEADSRPVSNGDVASVASATAP